MKKARPRKKKRMSDNGGKECLTVIDNRTGKTYLLPLVEGKAIRAMDLRNIKVDENDFGIMAYDPAFKNTAYCKSNITFIDGEKGELRYRGYSIEELSQKSSFLETAYLLIFGELPTSSELEQWVREITYHTMIHENTKKFMDGFHHDAHPMGILVGTIGALSTFYPDAKIINDRDCRLRQMIRLIAKMPTLAAFAYRHSVGARYSYPDNDLSYTGNFLNMMSKRTELKYSPNPVIEKALDVLFILHADHEQNCSTTAVKVVGSANADPFSAVAAGCAALYGPLHGGANEAVLKMLSKIRKKQNIPSYIQRVKAGEVKLMGFGHRVYKNYDPRAKVLKGFAHQVFEVTGKNPLLDIALELEKIALEDEYFVSRRLFPNVDFYSGIIYQAMGFPIAMFPVLFAIPRTAGWLAQWEEMLEDKETKIARPRQIYMGKNLRPYLPIEKR